MAANSYHHVVLIEQFVAGTEPAISLVDGRPRPAVEIHPNVGVYDFGARSTPGPTRFHAPARLDGATLTRCADTPVAAHELVGCRHVTTPI